MNVDHTPEPWFAEGSCNDPNFHAITAGSRPAPDEDREDMIAEVTTKANRARIVACVNTLAGIPDPLRDLETARQSLRNAIAQLPTDLSGVAHIRAALDLLNGSN